MEGKLFDIQKFSLNDGPGMRTTLFFKGCPLSCWWCHNPESQSIEDEMQFWEERCISCKTCEGIEKGNLQLLAEACPANALELKGKNYTVEMLVEEVLKDKVFYDQSKGGVTFSGGEPLMQVDFIVLLAKALKKYGIHIALDTTGYGKWQVLEKTLDIIDLYLYDVKHLDSKKHKEMTGVDNRLILENLTRLSEQGENIYIRVPIIPSFNDDLDYINTLASWLKERELTRVNILPYHNIGIDKYKRLGKKYAYQEIKPPSNKEMDIIKQVMETYDLNVVIGG